MSSGKTYRIRPLVKRIWDSILELGRVVWYYLYGLYSRIDEHHIFLLAGGLAFSLFICVIPLVLIIFSVTGVVLEQPTIRHEIELFIEHTVPYPEHAEFVKDIVFNRVEEFRHYKSVAGLIGVIGILLASSSLFSSLRTILNSVYKVRRPESIIYGKIRDLGFIVLVLVFFLVSTATVTLIDIISNFISNIPFFSTEGNGLLGEIWMSILSLVIGWTGFFLVYFVVPLKRPRLKVILVSATTAAILWHVTGFAFEQYVTSYVTLKHIYGAYAFLLAIGFWIYYTSVIFIVAAVIGQLYRERSNRLLALEAEEAQSVEASLSNPDEIENNAE